MSTSPAEQPAPGLVTFTAEGNHALDRLAADLVDQCDGSTASIADILDRVLSADIETLAESLSESLSEAVRPVTAPGAVEPDAPEVGPPAESPDDAARRRLGTHSPAAGAPAATRTFGVGR